MDQIQARQEEEYDFPYHHLVEVTPFSETKHLWWGYKYAAYLEKLLDTLSGRTFTSIVDIGCGDGKVAREIQKRFPSTRVVGTDYSEKSLAFARAFSPNTEFVRETKEAFDAFVMIEVLEHIPPKEIDEFINSVAANLKPDGFGIITVPSVNLPLHHKHYQHFTKETATIILERRFVVEKCEYLNAKNPWLIQRLLANKFYILNYQPIVNWLYKKYKSRYLHANPATGTQLFIIVRKK